MKPKYIVVLALILLSACKEQHEKVHSEEKKVQTITIKENDILKDIKCSDVIELDSLVILETTEESLIGEIDKVIVSNDRIYVLDADIAKSVFCFNREGKFIRRFKNIGDGPLEYHGLLDMSSHNGKIYVLAEPNRFFILDKDLNNLRPINIRWTKEVYFDIPTLSVLNSDTIIIADIYLPYKYNFYSIKDKKFISKRLIKRGPGDRFTYPPVTKSPEGVLFVTEDYDNTVYTVTGDDLIPTYFVDFEKPITEKELSEQLNTNLFTIPRPIVKSMYRINSFMENNKYISFSFLYNRRRHYFYLNKIDKRSIIFPSNINNDVYGSKYFRSAKGFYGNSIITVAESIDLIENRDNLNISLPSGITPESNPVLVFYHPKFN